MPQYKLVFRSDTRRPNETNGPFRIGFQSRDYDSASRAEFPVQFGSEAEGFTDVNTPTAVCLTPEIAAAVLFPQTEEENIWVYAMGIDITDPYTLNAHAQQVTSHKGLTPGSAPPIYWYAREWAVKAVPVEQIAAGIQVIRRFAQNGGTESFKIVTFEKNLKCGIFDDHWKLLFTYLRDLQGRGWMPAAKIVDGFISRSLGRKMTMVELENLMF